MAKRCFYALKTNEGNQVFDNWDDCSKARKGHTGVAFKAFATEQMANDWLNGERPVYAALPKGNVTVFYTDGSNNADTMVPGYGFAIAKKGALPDDAPLTLSGSTEEEGLRPLRNIAGEIMAAMKAVQFALRYGLTDIELRYDYAGVGEWPAGRFTTENNEYYEKYADWMRRMGERLNITYTQIPGHSGDYYNEMADVLARKGCGAAVRPGEAEELKGYSAADTVMRAA